MLAEAENEQGQETTFTRTVKAAPSEVYRAFTHPVALRDWLCDAAEVEPRAGGRFYLSWDKGYYTSGKYTELARNERVGFTWRGPTDLRHSTVLVTLSQEGDGTRVELTHTSVRSGQEWADLASPGMRSWDDALENLQSILETGMDLRLVRRPMFGLNGAAVLTAEMAAEFGVPVEEGLRLTALVEGLAAHNAGLRADDVLVSVGDYPIRDYNSLGSALGLHKAGDRVPAVFYRAAEQHTVTLELSPRQMPEVPQTMQALAEHVRKDNTELRSEIDTLIEGVSEEEAEYRPNEGTWNAKEELAHLIAGEYDGHATIANFIADAPDDPFYYANDFARLRPLVSAHGTLAALAEEFKRCLEVTVRMLESMPAPSSERKRNIFRLGLGYVGLANHTREHYAEIKVLVEAARK